MSGLRIEGNTSGRVAAVDGGSNLQVAFSNVPAYIGGVKLFSEVDAGTITGNPLLISPHTTSEYRMKIGLDTILFSDSFNATTQNTSIWLYYFATMTITQAGGFAIFNTNLDTTNAHGCSLQTFRTFALPGQSTITVEFNANMSSSIKANQIFEMGLFRPASTPTTAPTDGIFWRFDNSGGNPRLQGVMVYNGGTEQTVTLTAGLPTVGSNACYTLTFDATTANFWIEDVLIGSISVTGLNAAPFIGGGLPIGMQQRNIGSVGASGVQMKIANVIASYDEVNTVKPWNHQLAGFDLMASQGQNGGTMGSTSLMTNSLNPSAAAIANATASATFTGLGGQFPVNPTLTAGTDGILCAYQNPAGGINQTPRVLYITDISIQGVVTTLLVGGPVIYAYALCYGGSSVSLAQAETASFATGTTKAFRRIPLGYETYAAAAAVGVTSGTGVKVRLTTPIAVNPGEWINISAKNLGTVTTGGVITVLVLYNGYWE